MLMLRDPIFAGLSTIQSLLRISPPPRGTFASMRSISAPRSLKKEKGLQRSNILGNSTGFGDSSFLYTYIYICIIYTYLNLPKP